MGTSWFGCLLTGLLLLAALAPSGNSVPPLPVAAGAGAFSVPSLHANASAVDTGGTWNCGQGVETVDLFGEASAGTPPYQYRWDFGDGSPASVAQNPVHTYRNVLHMVANLTVTDATNATAQAVASAAWVVPTDCTGSRGTDWGGLLLYSGLLAGVAVGAVLFVRYRPDRPPPPP